MRDPSHDEGLPPPPLSDDERAFRKSLEGLVDWYRVRQSHVLWRAFWPAAFVLLPLGCVLVAVSMGLRGLSPELRLTLTIAGVVATASGPLWALFQLLSSMRRDLYVAIRLEGLGVRLDPEREEALYTWESITAVQYDEARRVLEVELTDGAPLALTGPFAELELSELCRRIRDARRLAVWHRLRPRNLQGSS